MTAKTDLTARLTTLSEALTEIREVIDFYKGGFSYQGLYSIRAILAEVGVEPDTAVVMGEKESPLDIEHRSGNPRRPGKAGRLDDPSHQDHR